MRVSRVPTALLFALLLASFPQHTAFSQSVNDLLRQLGIQELARDYLRPGVDAVGYSINSGLSHRARVDSGFGLWVGSRFIITYIPEADRTFSAALPAALVEQGYPERVTSATIVGGAGTVLRSTQQQRPDIVLPGGADLSSTFLLVPQVHVGAVLGTELIFRGLPPVTYDTDIGKVSFWGVGIKHAPTYFADLPFDLAFVAAWQRFELGDLINGASLAGMAQASVDAGSITLFGGIGYEAYAIDVSYAYNDATGTLPPTSINLEFRRRNLRFSAGASLSILNFIDIAADYSFGEQDNLTIGAGFTF